ncbi:MAG: anti-sigma factor domain-containing protein [Actinomycetota bacterium]
MRDHDVIEELISIRALGGLDAGDGARLAREVAAHGSDCEECRRLEDDYAEVAGRLAFALEPVRVREGFEDEVVTLAVAGPDQVARGPRAFARNLVAVAAAVALLAGGWLLRDLTGGAGAPSPAEFLAGAELVRFQGTGGELAVVYHPGEDGAYLFGLDLQTPPQGRVYEVWLIQDGTPVPGACFTPAETGQILTFVDASLAGTDLMAVTVEPSECSTSPTTTPILTADLDIA